MTAPESTCDQPALVLRRDEAGWRSGGIHAWNSADLGDTDCEACSWRWDGSTLRLHTGPLNQRAMFVASAPGILVVAPSLIQALHWLEDKSLDFKAIAVFLRLGFFLGADTPFQRIRVVPADVDLQWIPGTELDLPETARRWTERTERGSFLEQSFGESVRHAVRSSRISGDLIHPVSGGRDSRHLLLELAAFGNKPALCLTSELPLPRTNEDVRIAKMLCHRLGLDHRVVPLSRQFTKDMAWKNEKTNFCADEHTWAVPLAKLISARRCTVFDGIGGDVLSAGLFSTKHRIDLFRRHQLDELAEDVLGNNEAFLRLALPADWLNRMPREAALARLSRELKHHLDLPNPVASFFFRNRTRREIAQYSYGMYGSQVQVRAPFLHPDVVSLLMGIPAELTVDKQLHTRTIHRMHPAYADVPFGLPDSDPAALQSSGTDARAWFKRSTLTAAAQLTLRRSGPLRKWPLVARLLAIALHGDADRCWIDVEKVFWLSQVWQAGQRGRSSGEAAHAMLAFGFDR